MINISSSPMTLAASVGAHFLGILFSQMVAGSRVLLRPWGGVDQNISLLDKAFVLQEAVLLERPKQKHKV